MPQLLIDIKGKGTGPISTARAWERSLELDRVGPIGFEVSSSDRQARFLDTDDVVTATILREDKPLLAVGAGYVERTTMAPGGLVPMIRVVGSDIGIDLATRTVGDLVLTNSTTAAAVTAIMGFAPAGWTYDVATHASAGNLVTVTFAGENVLEALGKIAELSGEHFHIRDYLLVWLFTAHPATSIRAIRATPGAALLGNNEVCIITKLNSIKDVASVYSRVRLKGVGVGEARIDLTTATWTPPAGYTLDAANSWLIHNASDAARRREYNLSLKEVEDPNTLAIAGYEFLKRHLTAQRTYELEISKLEVMVYPGYTMHVIYWDLNGYGDKVLDIDALLTILAVKTSVDTNGRTRVIGLTVAEIDRWPVTNNDILVGLSRQASAMESHDQPVSKSTTSGSSGTVTTGPAVLAISNTPVIVASSVTETSLFSVSIPVNTLGLRNILRVTLHGKFTNLVSTAGSYAPTLRAKFGATTVFTSTPANQAGSANQHDYLLVCDILGNEALNSQRSHGWASMGSAAGITGITNGDSTVQQATKDPFNEDNSIASKTLVLTVQLPASHVDLRFEKTSVSVELIRV